MEKSKKNQQWDKMSTIFLNHISAPLRPVDQDLQYCNDLIETMHQEIKNIHGLILGVTPEYFHLNWPENTILKAIDKTEEMIEHVWPGAKTEVTLGAWEDMPFHESSMNIVLCDGGLHLLSNPDTIHQLIQKLNDVIAPDGYLLFRLFVPSKTKNTPEEVLADLLSGKIPSLNHLKMRLASSLQKSSVEGVQLSAIWDAVHSVEKDQSKLATLLNWDLDHLRAINVYQDSKVRYYLLALEEVINLLTINNNNIFSVDMVAYPSYFHGEYYPTVIFKKVSS